MTRQTLINKLQSSLRQRTPRSIEQPSLAEAAVLVAITEEDEPELILTLRARHLNSHSGEVAFAGGKKDDTDASLIGTALREANEEIGLESDQVTVIGQLDQVVSRYGYLVTPVVGLIPPDVALTANPDELDSVFKVPLDFFLSRDPDEYFERGSFSIPTYYFGEYRIWGLTAMMIVEMMNNHFDADIRMKL